MHHLPRGWNKQETPRRVQGSSKSHGEHCEVLHLLPHEKVFVRPEKDGLLHHGRDDRTCQDQPADKNPVEKEVHQNLGKHKPLLPTASKQEEHKELPLHDDEVQHGVLGIECEEVDHVTNKSDDD